VRFVDLDRETASMLASTVEALTERSL
jgi:hypothetical protein